MAFQRPFLISLKRSDPSQKWGFSIQGGSDRCEPLTVQQVAEGSLSERCGLRQGDELIQVGRVNVQDLPIGQVYELLARCGNKIEMFVVREDLLTPRKGKEPPVVKAVVHNPYNSPLSLYSAENVADTLGKQAEVLTEGHVSTEEDEGPENLSFRQKSAVFQLLEEQSKQETAPNSRSVQQSTAVKKPKSAPPPPPPKPKPPVQDNIHNGYHQETQYNTQYQRGLNQYEQQQYNQTPLRENVNYQQLPGGYQVTYQNSYQTSSSPVSPVVNPQQYSGSYQSQVTYQTTQGSHSPVTTGQQPHYPGHVTTRQESHRSTSHQQTSQQQYTSGYQQPQRQLQQQPSAVHQQSNQQQQSVAYQQPANQQTSVAHQQPRSPGGQQTNAYQQQQVNYQQQQQQQQQVNYQQQQQRREQERPQQQQSVSKAEFKIGPPPPTRSSSNKQQLQRQNQQDSNMTAIYKQQYEQHLQKQYEQEQMLLNQLNHDDASKPRAHIIEGEIFEHNSTSGTPITYKTPPTAPPKPVWPPPERSTDNFRGAQSASPSGMDVTAAWPPKKSSAVELPRTGFNPAAVREQGTGRRCVWPPQEYEFHSGRNTPQSPITGRRIQWNPSPSPPSQRRTLVSPGRRKDIQWPPPSPTGQNNGFDKENQLYRNSPRLSRKAQFDDYIHEHASINVPQTYRPPPGTQHVEFH